MATRVFTDGRLIPDTNAYRNLDLGSTGQVVYAGPVQVTSYYISNANSSSAMWVKFYNKATAATNADTPVRTLMVPAGSAANLALESPWFFSTGLSVRATGGVADNDTTAPTTNNVIVNLSYLI